MLNIPEESNSGIHSVDPHVVINDAWDLRLLAGVFSTWSFCDTVLCTVTWHSTRLGCCPAGRINFACHKKALSITTNGCMCPDTKRTASDAIHVCIVQMHTETRCRLNRQSRVCISRRFISWSASFLGISYYQDCQRDAAKSTPVRMVGSF